MTNIFDVIVLGGGKGGKTLAVYLAQQGQKVLMIEDNRIGGTCINVACIPTKTLVKSAKILHDARMSDKYGVSISKPIADIKKIIARKDNIVNGMKAMNLKQFNDSGMTLLNGHGKFISPTEIEITLNDSKERVVVSAEKIFINTGALPFIPKINGLEQVSFHTNESLLNISYIPKHLMIIGGGYIGLEFAQIFNRFGSHVTVIESNSEFLSREDRDVAAAVLQLLQSEGIDVILDAKIDSVEKHAKDIKINLQVLGVPKDLHGSDLLISVGRIPNSKNIGLEHTKIKTAPNGAIIVDDFLETTQKNVWALGDVKGGAQFTHLSWDDYRIIKNNLYSSNAKKSISNRLIPYTVFLDPELARIGITEKEAVDKSLDYLIYKIPAAMIPRAKTTSEEHGFLKAIVDKNTRLILGVSILCCEAGEILGVIQLAMESRRSIDILKDMMFAHPTFVESLNIWFSDAACQPRA